MTTTVTANHLRSAVRALQRGFHVFPVEPNAKTPIRIYQDRPEADAPWTVRWSEIATNDLAKVVDWWSHAPTANVGVACKPSGLLVIDCDTPKREGLLNDTPWAHLHRQLGPFVHGEDLFGAVAYRYGDVDEAFDTFTVATGSGGLHLYYRWPDGVASTQDSIVKGVLDVRCNGGERGGYVLAEGSRTESGPYGVRNEAPIRDTPGWLVELVRHRDRRMEARPPDTPFRRARNPHFGGLAQQVRYAADGNLNNTLLWAARAMCQDGAPIEECEALLAPAYVDANGRGGYRQAGQTIRSAYRLQQRKM